MRSNPTYIIDPVEWPKSLATERLDCKAAVLAYLKGFKPVARTGGRMVDVFTGKSVNLGFMGAYTDGAWC